MVESSFNWLLDRTIELGSVFLVAALWILGTYWLGGFVGRWVASMMAESTAGWNGAVLVSRLASVVIRVVGVLLALSSLGVSGTGLLAVVSAFTVAIGLSLQDVMKNFFAGIYLLLERPFKVGDRIVVKDVVGEVQGIDIRTTLIRNTNKELVLVPNATVFTEILRNDTYYGVRRVEFRVQSADRTLHDMEERLHASLEEIESIKRPIPGPRIVSSNADGVTVVMSLVMENTDEAQNAVAEAVIAALPGDTIEVTSA
jgi:small-conductance mechanosensitive channel